MQMRHAAIHAHVFVMIRVPEVPPMSMALRLRAFMMLTVMVLAVGL